MKILLTNDDGISAKGLLALKNELSKIADCVVVAPECEQSAVGHAITISKPLMVKEVKRDGRFWGYAVAGTPADCVKLGIQELVKGKIDMVVSGINRGANVGVNILYSGTVSATTESIILGVPSIAISLDSYAHDADYASASKIARQIVSFFAKTPQTDCSFNVNVPAVEDSKIKKVCFVSQGKGHFAESFEKRMTPRGDAYYWRISESFVGENNIESDATLLSQGIVTITPIHFNMTDYRTLQELLNQNINELLVLEN
ncbi:MAG: 5'/3'-nucleotidase SurE [Deltaproteobacteria bacterium]